MKFPIYDISDCCWDKYMIKEHNILFENPYSGLIPFSKRKFWSRIKKFKYIDANGVIYKVSDFKIYPKKGPSKFLFWIQNIEFLFNKSEELYNLEEFKELLVKRARETNNKTLENIVMKANSFEDILGKFTH